MYEYILIGIATVINIIGLRYIVKRAMDNKSVKLISECYCKDCVFYEAHRKIEDFDGRCHARTCETDRLDFCNYALKKGANDEQAD